MPAASADLTCSVRSAAVSPIAAIEMRSSAGIARLALAADLEAEGLGGLVGVRERVGIAAYQRRVGLELVRRRLSLIDHILGLLGSLARKPERPDVVELALNLRHERVGGERVDLLGAGASLRCRRFDPVIR